MAQNQEAKFFSDLISSISPDRFYAYNSIGQDRSDKDTFARYLWNIELSESLYPLINTFEIALRNNIYNVFQESFDPRWLHGQGALNLTSDTIEKIDKAKNFLQRRGQITDSKIIAELSLGFWVSLFNRRYYQAIWLVILQRDERLRNNIFSGAKPPAYHILKAHVERIRDLRNLISHHESVLRFEDQNAGCDLQTRYRELIEMIGWLHPATKEIAIDINRFEVVYSHGPNYYHSLIEKHIQKFQ